MSDKKIEIRHVTWLDSRLTLGWHDDRDPIPLPMLCVSVGFVLEDSSHCVVLVSSFDAQAGWANAVTIPRSAIRNEETLVEGRSAREGTTDG